MCFFSEMMNCQDPIDSTIMRIAAHYMSENWRMVIRDLGILDPEISQTMEQCAHMDDHRIKEVIYKLLLIWFRNSDDPSIGILTTILWNNENYICVYQLKKHFKKDKKKSKKNNTAGTTETSEIE